MNTEYATGARCLGSIPNNPNSKTTTKYNPDSNLNQALKDFYSEFEDEDDNYKIDIEKMKELNISYDDCWLASRGVLKLVKNNSNKIYFYVREGATIDNNYIEAYNVEAELNSNTGKLEFSCIQIDGDLKPVFTLKDNLKISSGLGTEMVPWRLSNT